MHSAIRKHVAAAVLAALSAIAAPSLVQAQNAAAPQPVVHIEILGIDAPRLQHFYAELFGWKSTLNPAGYGYVPVAPIAPVALTGGIGQSPQRQPLAIFYVKVADPAATLARAEMLGGRIVLPPFEVPGGIMFGRFADPEGNVVGVVRRPN